MDAARTIQAQLEKAGREATRDLIDLWFQESNDYLQEAASRRTELGAQRGIQGREQNGLAKIQQAMQPPQWDDQEEAWVWSNTHYGAVYQEFGVREHEIRAKEAEVLAFEWPDAPQDVQEQFEHTEGDLVFFESVQHPGLPAVPFTRHGQERALQTARAAGGDIGTIARQIRGGGQ